MATIKVIKTSSVQSIKRQFKDDFNCSTFDMGNRDMLLVVFFTTIGLSSRLDVLRKGGRLLVVLLALAVGYLIVQNLVGIGIASLVGRPPALGLLAGSVSLSGVGPKCPTKQARGN